VPALEIEIPESELLSNVYLDDKYQRSYRTVDIYASRILNASRTEDVTPDIWCVIIPEYVYQYCRPKSVVPTELQIRAKTRMSPRKARNYLEQSSLFKDEKNNIFLIRIFTINLKLDYYNIRYPHKLLENRK